MRLGNKQILIAGMAALATMVFSVELRPAQSVVWVDFDMKSITEPTKRQPSYYDYFFETLITEQVKHTLDVPRWVRTAAGRKKPAANVNALDEVPNSSWYANRHHLRRMTPQELAQGPNPGNGPDFSRAVIKKAKLSGVTPGLLLEDNTGQSYMIKFDRTGYPELQSGAEVVSTKILYAAGYNVPENYIAYIDPDRLQIQEHIQIVDDRHQKRDLTQMDLLRMLEHATKAPDGRYRVMASKILPGKPEGPFPQIGLRRDDMNDLIPHEHRRELRGLRVIASWLNHWDMKEDNSLDMYVEEGGRHFLRHYLIDFGSTLGGAKEPLETFHGREYIFDYKNVFKELFTLGIYSTPDDEKSYLISPSIGTFSARDFDPEKWKPTAPVMAFENMTTEDAFWGTRIVLSFSESDLRSIIDTAQYSNPGDRDYLLKTLLERQRILARHWLDKVNPLAQFSVKTGDHAVTLTFHDLAVDGDFAGGVPGYSYRITSNHYTSPQKVSRGSSIDVDRDALDSAGIDGSATIEVAIWPAAGNGAGPVQVSLYRPGGSRTFRIEGIRRRG